MLAGPVQPDGATQVVHHKPDLRQAQRVEELLQDALEEAKAIGRIKRLIRLAKARQIERDGAVGGADGRQDVAPQKRRGRPAMQEQDRRAAATFQIVQTQAVDGYEAAFDHGGPMILDVMRKLY